MGYKPFVKLPYPSEHSSKLTHLTSTEGLLQPNSISVSHRPHNHSPPRQRSLLFPFKQMCFVKELHKVNSLVRCVLEFQPRQPDSRAAFPISTASTWPGRLRLELTPLQCEHPVRSPGLLAALLPLCPLEKFPAPLKSLASRCLSPL